MSYSEILFDLVVLMCGVFANTAFQRSKSRNSIYKKVPKMQKTQKIYMAYKLHIYLTEIALIKII